MSLIYRHFHVLEVVALAVLLLSSTAAAAESAEVLAKKLVAASHAQDYNAVVKLIAAGLYLLLYLSSYCRTPHTGRKAHPHAAQSLAYACMYMMVISCIVQSNDAPTTIPLQLHLKTLLHTAHPKFINGERCACQRAG